MLTALPCPMEKLSQLTMAVLEPWLIAMVPGAGVLIAALPCTTLPPVGSVSASSQAGVRAVPSASAKASAEWEPARLEAE